MGDAEAVLKWCSYLGISNENVKSSLIIPGFTISVPYVCKAFLFFFCLILTALLSLSILMGSHYTYKSGDWLGPAAAAGGYLKNSVLLILTALLSLSILMGSHYV